MNMKKILTIIITIAISSSIYADTLVKDQRDRKSKKKLDKMEILQKELKKENCQLVLIKKCIFPKVIFNILLLMTNGDLLTINMM